MEELFCDKCGQIIGPVEIDSWKGKSSFKWRKYNDIIYVTKYQKLERGAEPKQFKYRLFKEDLDKFMVLIENHYYYSNKILKSRDLAEQFYKIRWKEIFNNRKMHNKYTITMNVLDKMGFINYRGGKIKLKEDYTH